MATVFKIYVTMGFRDAVLTHRKLINVVSFYPKILRAELFFSTTFQALGKPNLTIN